MKGTLAQAAPNNGTVWTLPISNVTTAGNESVSIDKTGIAAGPQNVTVHRDTVPPADVSRLDKEVDKAGNLTLTWTDPADADFASVEVTRTVDGTDTPATVSKGTQTYTTPLARGKDYTYTVKTVDTAGNKSNGVPITIALKTLVITDIPKVLTSIDIPEGPTHQHHRPVGTFILPPGTRGEVVEEGMKQAMEGHESSVEMEIIAGTDNAVITGSEGSFTATADLVRGMGDDTPWTGIGEYTVFLQIDTDVEIKTESNGGTYIITSHFLLALADISFDRAITTVPYERFKLVFTGKDEGGGWENPKERGSEQSGE
jgi:hypothetical protein